MFALLSPSPRVNIKTQTINSATYIENLVATPQSRPKMKSYVLGLRAVQAIFRTSLAALETSPKVQIKMDYEQYNLIFPL